MVEGDVRLAALNGPDIGPVNACMGAEFLLRPPLCFSQSTYVLGKQLTERRNGHPVSLADLTQVFNTLYLAFDGVPSYTGRMIRLQCRESWIASRGALAHVRLSEQVFKHVTLTTSLPILTASD